MYFVVQSTEDGMRTHQAPTKELLWDLILGEREGYAGEREGGLVALDETPAFSPSIVNEYCPSRLLTVIKGEIVMPTAVQVVTGWDIE